MRLSYYIGQSASPTFINLNSSREWSRIEQLSTVIIQTGIIVTQLGDMSAVLSSPVILLHHSSSLHSSRPLPDHCTSPIDLSLWTMAGIQVTVGGGVPWTTWLVSVLFRYLDYLLEGGGECGGVLVLERREACTNNTKSRIEIRERHLNNHDRLDAMAGFNSRTSANALLTFFFSFSTCRISLLCLRN